MNPEQQRVAIAEACGWSHKTIDNHTYWWHDENNKYLPLSDDGMRQCPNFLHDLNAMHEAEKTLTDKAHEEFRLNLYEVLGDDSRLIVSSTAAQRAEAFLRTIGKWEESK